MTSGLSRSCQAAIAKTRARSRLAVFLAVSPSADKGRKPVVWWICAMGAPHASAKLHVTCGSTGMLGPVVVATLIFFG